MLKPFLLISFLQSFHIESNPVRCRDFAEPFYITSTKDQDPAALTDEEKLSILNRAHMATLQAGACWKDNDITSIHHL
jgi:hypothetical protein